MAPADATRGRSRSSQGREAASARASCRYTITASRARDSSQHPTPRSAARIIVCSIDHCVSYLNFCCLLSDTLGKRMDRNGVRDFYANLKSSSDLKTTACVAARKPHPLILASLTQIPDAILDRFYGCGVPVPLGIEGLTVFQGPLVPRGCASPCLYNLTGRRCLWLAGA